MLVMQKMLVCFTKKLLSTFNFGARVNRIYKGKTKTDVICNGDVVLGKIELPLIPKVLSSIKETTQVNFRLVGDNPLYYPYVELADGFDKASILNNSYFFGFFYEAFAENMAIISAGGTLELVKIKGARTWYVKAVSVQVTPNDVSKVMLRRIGGSLPDTDRVFLYSLCKKVFAELLPKYNALGLRGVEGISITIPISESGLFIDPIVKGEVEFGYRCGHGITSDGEVVSIGTIPAKSILWVFTNLAKSGIPVYKIDYYANSEGSMSYPEPKWRGRFVVSFK